MSKSTLPSKWMSYFIMIIGALMIVGGVTTWGAVSVTLSNERIIVSSDASCAGGAGVQDPITAYCQADIIKSHELDATGGKTYSELGRDDPLREVAMNGSFLRASLFTSVVAFGVAGLAIGAGLVFLLVGIAILNLAARTEALTAESTEEVPAEDEGKETSPEDEDASREPEAEEDTPASEE